MATHVALYIKTNNVEKVLEKLSSLTGLQRSSTEKFPADFHKQFVLGNSPAFYYVIGVEQKDWLTIYYNNFDKRIDWCTLLSAEYATQIIVVMLQTTSDYYYFAAYDKGKLLREIEICYSDDSEIINTGDKFAFEDKQIIGKEADNEYFFNDMVIERYCHYFNLSIREQHLDVKWCVMRGKKSGETLEDRLLTIIQKPWWKFW